MQGTVKMIEHYYQITKPKFSGEQWKNGQVLPILYPVFIHPLTCAVRNHRKMNVFQDSIFRLVVSGCLNVVEIANLLNLNKDLVLWILHTQLINGRGLLDNNLKITEAGQKYLDEHENDDTELRIIWAFQDGLTGEWLPRFCYPTDEMEVFNFDENGLPSFLISLESGKKEKPYRLNFEYPQNLNPDFSELLDMPSKEYISDFSFAIKNGNKPLKQAHIRKIVTTPQTAKKAWLYSYVFTNELSEKNWLVSDPFGLKDAVKWLRIPITDSLEQNNHLANKIVQMLGQQPSDKLSPSQYLSQIDEQAKLQLVAEYAWLDKVPNATDYLLSIFKLNKQLELSNNQHDIDNLLIQSQNLIESILKYWIEQYPVNTGNWPSKKNWYSIKLNDFFNYIPIIFSKEIQDILLRQKTNEVLSALFYNNKSMKATLFAVLLSTIEHPNHILLTIDTAQLQLGKLLELADKRNSVGHASTQNLTKIDKDEALLWAEFTVNWVKLFQQSLY